MMVVDHTLWRILRARGGSSIHKAGALKLIRYSPRTRR